MKIQLILNLSVVIFLLCCEQHVFAQYEIDYEKLSFQEALEKAKKEKKLVFMDAYTEWCTICKMMDKDVFSTKDVADFFNKHFVCVKYDMEKGEGPALKKRYGITGFPTFFVFDEEGDVLHKFLGYYSPKDVIKEASKYNDNQYSSVALERRYLEGDREKELMYEYFMFLYKCRNAQSLQVANELFELLSDEDKILEKYWMLFSYPDLSPYGSAHATYLISNYERFCVSCDKTEVEKTVLNLFIPQLRSVFDIHFTETITLEKLRKIESEIEFLPIKLQEYIQLYADLVRSFLQKDFVSIIRICDQKLKTLPDNRGVSIYMEMMDIVCENVSVDQKKIWFELGESLVKNIKNISVQKRIQSMIQQNR